MGDDRLSVRCFCRKRPLLAVCGRDTKTGELFVHVKSFRGDRIFTELVVTRGVVRIRCRDCLRWHTVTIRSTLQVTEEALPETIKVAAS